ncbi:MAG: Zn-dependent protease, partial [Anaerolineae bacterium]
MQYWHAIALANVGRVADALSIFGTVFREDANWRTLTERLPQVGLLDVGEEELAQILAQGVRR